MGLDAGPAPGTERPVESVRKPLSGRARISWPDLLEKRLEPGLEELAGLVHPPRHRVLRAAEDAGRVGVAEALVDDEGERGPEMGRQRRDGLVDPGRELVQGRARLPGPAGAARAVVPRRRWFSSNGARFFSRPFFFRKVSDVLTAIR